MKIRLLLILCVVVGSVQAQSGQKPYVIMVSFDGFRHDYVEKYNLPNFKKLIRQGVATEALIPSFPSKTFPNHYTLVTGLYPGNHGLVDNEFYDAEQKKLYAIRRREMVEDPSFYGGTPLWQLAQQQGLKSASFFWVGSEAKIQGTHPNYFKLYDPKIKNEERITQTVNWLQLPEAERPHFISLYFSMVDHEAHTTGPTSIQTQKVLHSADSLVGMLMRKVQKINLPVNIVIVSDHGLYEMKREGKVFRYVDKLINVKDSSVVFANAGSQVHFYTTRVDSLYNVLNAQANGFKVYRQNEFPERWHYKHVRSGDVLIVAEPGTYFLTTHRDLSQWEGTGNFGEHGYDPAVTREVHGIFYAMGPNVKKGVKLKPFENIHVYPLVAKILGLKTPEIDGDEKVLETIYQGTIYNLAEMISMLKYKWTIDSVEQHAKGFWRIEDKFFDLRDVKSKSSPAKAKAGDLYLELNDGKGLIKIVGDNSYYEVLDLSDKKLVISWFFQDKNKSTEVIKVTTVKLSRN